MMFDWIEILAAPLSLMLIVFALLSFFRKSYLVAVVFFIIAVLPMLWAGYFRLPIPQTLIWMGMNICAIIFLWQGFLGLIVKSASADFLPIPLTSSNRTQNLFSLMTGLLFAALIILTRF